MNWTAAFFFIGILGLVVSFLCATIVTFSYSQESYTPALLFLALGATGIVLGILTA